MKSEMSTLGGMSELGGPEELGASIRQRREALGLSVLRLAELAGVGRDTLTRLEAGEGKTRGTTAEVVKRALTELEELRDEPEPNNGNGGVVRFEIEGVYGAKSIVVQGPVENLAEIQEAVDRLLRRRESEQ